MCACLRPPVNLQTAVTMLYVLHELAKNPDAQEKLYNEVSSVLGSSSVVTEEHIHHLHYLKGCIKEALRYMRCFTQVLHHTYMYSLTTVHLVRCP